MISFNDKLDTTKVLTGILPASVTEYQLINDRVARVIVATVSNPNVTRLMYALESGLGQAVSPIRSSFRWLTNDKTSLVGFVTLATPQRLLDQDDPVTAGYRLIAKNMYMSQEDESVWEMKKASAGTYMVRHGQDDLGELLEASRVSPRGATPRMASLVSASAQPTELVAFVNSRGSRQPAVEYGFAVKREDGGVSVVCAGYSDPLQVRSQEIVASYTLDTNEVHRHYKAGAERQRVQAGSDKSASIEYYKKLYSYAPDYLKMVIQEVEEMAAM